MKAIGEKASRFKRQGYDIRIGIAGSFLDKADLSDWYGRAKEAFPDDELLYDPLTCSASNHVGPNAFGMGVNVKIMTYLYITGYSFTGISLLLYALEKPFSTNLRKESTSFHKKQKDHRKRHRQASL